MSDIFISYASEDREDVRALAEILEGQGWSVWWDRTILPGKRFDEEIQSALDQAKCVVVVWSGSSVKSDWVKEEIADAAKRGILVPALIEDVAIPLGYRRFQAATLSNWDGDVAHPEFQQMLTAVAGVIADRTKATNEPAQKIQTRSVKIKKESEAKGSENWSAKIVSETGVMTPTATFLIKTDAEHILEYHEGFYISKLILDGKVIARKPNLARRYTFMIEDQGARHDAELILGGLVSSNYTLTVAGRVLLNCATK